MQYRIVTNGKKFRLQGRGISTLFKWRSLYYNAYNNITICQPSYGEHNKLIEHNTIDEIFKYNAGNEGWHHIKVDDLQRETIKQECLKELKKDD